MTFGGGCEMSLHADKVVAAAETYMGLVEFGVELYQVVVARKDGVKSL
jgi:enoyl-CoA hydratase/carnithine racemase